MLQKAEVSSRVRKGIQQKTVSSNLSEPKNRHIARNSGDEVPTQMTVTASVRAVTGSSSWKTGCSEERPFYAVLELTTEMRKPTVDAEMGFQRWDFTLVKLFAKWVTCTVLSARFGVTSIPPCSDAFNAILCMIVGGEHMTVLSFHAYGTWRMLQK